MDRSQQKHVRQLVARREQVKEMHDRQASYFASRGIDASHQLDGYLEEIRGIQTEILRRAMDYQDRSATLPQHLIDAIQRGDADSIRAKTLFELAEKWNAIVDGGASLNSMRASDQSTLTSILDEIERRVIEVEDREVKARQNFLGRIIAS